MRWICLLSLFFSPLVGASPSPEILGHLTFSGETKFSESRFGGISALHYDDKEKILWMVSDDRGNVDPPRLYKMRLTVSEKESKPSFELQFVSVVWVKEPGTKLAVFDFEGMAPLPWGGFLLSSEGDQAARPRRPPRLVEVKIPEEKSSTLDATVHRDFLLPEGYPPKNSGRPRIGLRTNYGFEGLGVTADGKKIAAAAEAHLVQDPKGTSRFLQFEVKESELLAQAEWLYPHERAGPKVRRLVHGISEILHDKGDDWLVLERGLEVKGKFALTAQIFAVALQKGRPIKAFKAAPATDLPRLSKRLVFDLEKSESSMANFEGMTWGPKLKDGRRLLIVATDNNFQSLMETQFLFLAWP